MERKENQSALILESDRNGAVSVNVVSGDHGGLNWRPFLGSPCFSTAGTLYLKEPFLIS